MKNIILLLILSATLAITACVRSEENEIQQETPDVTITEVSVVTSTEAPMQIIESTAMPEPTIEPTPKPDETPPPEPSVVVIAATEENMSHPHFVGYRSFDEIVPGNYVITSDGIAQVMVVYGDDRERFSILVEREGAMWEYVKTFSDAPDSPDDIPFDYTSRLEIELSEGNSVGVASLEGSVSVTLTPVS